MIEYTLVIVNFKDKWNISISDNKRGCKITSVDWIVNHIANILDLCIAVTSITIKTVMDGDLKRRTSFLFYSESDRPTNTNIFSFTSTTAIVVEADLFRSTRLFYSDSKIASAKYKNITFNTTLIYNHTIGLHKLHHSSDPVIISTILRFPSSSLRPTVLIIGILLPIHTI